MLMLICPCGHAALLPEELTGRLVCSQCNRAQEFESFKPPNLWMKWLQYLTRRAGQAEPRFRVEWRA